MSNLSEETTVQMHAWLKLECGSHEYADADMGDEYTGWSTYLRVPTPHDPQQPFTVREEQDHLTREAAMIAAKELSAKHGGAEIEVY